MKVTVKTGKTKERSGNLTLFSVHVERAIILPENRQFEFHQSFVYMVYFQGVFYELQQNSRTFNDF